MGGCKWQPRKKEPGRYSSVGGDRFSLAEIIGHVVRWHERGLKGRAGCNSSPRLKPKVIRLWFMLGYGLEGCFISASLWCFSV